MDFFSSLMPSLPWLIFVQGILLSLLVLSKGRYKSNRYLGIFLILLSFNGLVSLLWFIPRNRTFAEIYVGMGALPFLYGPLIYRYVWHGLYRDISDSVPFALHSIPAALDFLFYLILYLVKGRIWFLAVAEQVLTGNAPFYVSLLEWLKVLQGLFYCGLIVRMLFRHRKALKRLASGREHRRWLITLIIVFILNWVLVLVSAVILWTGRFSADFNLILSGVQLCAFLAFIYTLAFFAVRFPVILAPKAIREEIRKKLNLPAGFIEETLRRLEKAEKRKFYTDTEVTLASLASDLGLHPNALSFIINETREKGFLWAKAG